MLVMRLCCVSDAVSAFIEYFKTVHTLKSFPTI